MNDRDLLTRIANDVTYLRDKVDDHGEAITEVRLSLTELRTERRMEKGAWRWVTNIGVPAIVSAFIFVGGCIWKQS
jgi:hypothetical protein